MTGFSDLFKIPTGEPQFPAPLTEGWKPLLDIVKGSPLLSILDGRTPAGAGVETGGSVSSGRETLGSITAGVVSIPGFRLI